MSGAKWITLWIALIATLVGVGMYLSSNPMEPGGNFYIIFGIGLLVATVFFITKRSKP